MAKKKQNVKKSSKKKTDSTVLPKDYLSTGSWMLDLAIAFRKIRGGGVPTNRVIELSGTGMAGKTYVCGELCGNAIRKNYLSFVDDIERRWDLPRLRTFGFTTNNPNFHYVDPPSHSVEKCFDRLFALLGKKKKDDILYVIDPLAALYSEKEKSEAKMNQAKAKALQYYFKHLKDYIDSSSRSLSIVLSNQLIDEIEIGNPFFKRGGPQSKKKKTPGGNALEHWPSVRIRLAQGEKVFNKYNVPPGAVKIGETEDKTKEKKSKTTNKYVGGVKVRCEIVKNSEDDPYRVTQFTIRYGYGIDNIFDAATWLKSVGKLTGKKKSEPNWFFFGGEYVYSIGRFIHFIESNELQRELRELLIKTYEKVHERPQRVPKYAEIV